MDWSFGDFLWAMIVFYFWFIFIWAFIRVFSDIFRRDDISGWAKAGWIFFVMVFPFLGIIVYLIARPKMTEQDRRMMMEAEEAQRRMAGYSPAAEIEKLPALKESGKISAEEFEALKQRAMA